ncbi:hypothetical protein FRC01_007619 [Tulasnella sp. 417]|nr:hypothetical protein FRC01_007619 [Tulasnella sp. 417]
MALAVTELVFGTSLGSYILGVTIQDSHFRDWDNWGNVHSDFGRIAQLPRVLVPEFFWNRLLITWYIPVVGSVLFFIFFGFGQDAMTEYRRFFTWIRIHVFQRPPKPSNESVLPTFNAPPRTARIKLNDLDPDETSIDEEKWGGASRQSSRTDDVPLETLSSHSLSHASPRHDGSGDQREIESVVSGIDGPRTERDRESFHSSRLTGAISSSLNNLTDLFRDSTGHRNIKFPDKLFKVLDLKMQNIAMGKDPQYNDQYTRRVIAVFWGSLKAAEKSSSREPSTASWRQIKENRKIEELILFFVTTATQALRKDPNLSGDAWKHELDAQISQFILILRDCLRNTNHVPPEITSRLELYTARLAEDARHPGGHGPVGRGTPSIASIPASPAAPTGLSVPFSQNVDDMRLVNIVGNLFGKSKQELQSDVNLIKQLCSEKNALTDLKTCLKNINADMPFPGRRDDFESDEAFHRWRTQELAHLSQLMLAMIQLKPDLARFMPSDSSPTYSASQRPLSTSIPVTVEPGTDPVANITELTSDDEIEAGNKFVYIPPNPKKAYKRLVELCLERDLEAMAHLPEEQEVSLTILSQQHLELLNEITLRWRISHSYRVTCFLDVIRYKYERDEVPIECVPEGLQMVGKAMHEMPVEFWPRFDIDYVSTVYGGLFNVFLGALYEALEDITKLKPEKVAPYVCVLETVRTSGLVERYKADIDARLNDLGDRVRVQAVHQYTDKNYELMSNPDPNRALPLLHLTDHIEKQAKLLDRRFPKPILGRLDLVSLALESQIPLFLTDLGDMRVPLLEGSMRKPPEVPLADVFALYRRTKTLLDMHAVFCPSSPLDYDLGGFFEPYVLQYLVNTDLQTAQWVHTAISVDKVRGLSSAGEFGYADQTKFEAEGEEGHSSSIVDLFSNLKPPIDYLFNLSWPDRYQEARFFTVLSKASKTVSKLMEEYCRMVEDLFMDEMFPRQNKDEKQTKQYAFIEKARLTISGEKRVEPFNFTSSSCVKLNNIEAARNLLDKLYARIDVDKISGVLAEHAPLPSDADEKQRFLFTVKIVQAEGLALLEMNNTSKPDTFVTLSDEKGIRLAKTRTIYESLTPRWDEAFDLSVEHSLWIMASVRDRAVIGKHDTIGRGYLFLDPKRFGDYLAHDLWLDLDTSGRILLRISMEGEKDDPQFFFGRAFRSLKRAESDMIRVIIDKVAPLLRQYINRATLSTLVRSPGASYDYNKALAGVTGFYRSAIGADKADSLIPLPQQDKGRTRAQALSDEEIESALAPLFDYLDSNLQTFNNHLSEATKETVMAKIWKEMLTTIEDLLVPPLANTPSEMKALTDKEVDIVFKWLKFLNSYMYADGASPLTQEQLQNQKYRDLLSIRLYYDWHADELMEEAVRLMQQTLRAAPTVKKRAKTVYSQRNLGTIRDRKRQKKQEAPGGNTDMILRILRMRPNTTEFIAQQFDAYAQAHSEQTDQPMSRRRGPRSRASIPEVPPMPPLQERL